MPEEYKTSIDQLIADIDEKLRTIDEHMIRIKKMLSLREITRHRDRALFYAMNLMLKERKELVETKDKMLLGAREQILLEDSS